MIDDDERRNMNEVHRVTNLSYVPSWLKSQKAQEVCFTISDARCDDCGAHNAHHAIPKDCEAEIGAQLHSVKSPQSPYSA
jgi:hypothetical protein